MLACWVRERWKFAVNQIDGLRAGAYSVLIPTFFPKPSGCFCSAGLRSLACNEASVKVCPRVVMPNGSEGQSEPLKACKASSTVGVVTITTNKSTQKTFDFLEDSNLGVGFYWESKHFPTHTKNFYGNS